MSQKDNPERVGIVVVHGIGEQRRFEFLEEVVRNITFSLESDLGKSNVRVIVNTDDDAAYRAEQQTWKGEEVATAIIEVVDKNGKHINLEFREVWWSDLDEPNSFRTFLGFWCWGLSLWSKPPYDDNKVGTASQDMRLPGRSINTEQKKRLPDRDKALRPLHSLYLFLVSFVIFLLLPLLWVAGRALRSILGFDIRPEILVEYLGDIKLYQQDARLAKKPLVDLEEHPPRVSIRRRVVSTFVETALEDYDRWYVLSHSLGTIIAFNGLMETEKSLPNYLEQNLWKKWSNQRPSNCKFKEQDEKEQMTGGYTKKPLTEEDRKNMIPRRPSWLELDDVIDRKELFSKLKGFMTYGSPLSKFAVLWPSIVSLNKDELAFIDNFEWINVFDPTDPVSDFTRFFDSEGAEEAKIKLSPKEVPYKAGKVHLLSHGEYLTFNPKRMNPLVRQISRWLISGEGFQEPLDKDRDKFYRWGWPEPKVRGRDSFIVSVYFALGISIWFLLGIVISFILSWIFPWFIDQTSNLFLQLNLSLDLSWIKYILSSSLNFVIASAIIVFAVGFIARLLKANKNRVDPTDRKNSDRSEMEHRS
jgi:hypothetical protein